MALADQVAAPVAHYGILEQRQLSGILPTVFFPTSVSTTDPGQTTTSTTTSTTSSTTIMTTSSSTLPTTSSTTSSTTERTTSSSTPLSTSTSTTTSNASVVTSTSTGQGGSTVIITQTAAPTQTSSDRASSSSNGGKIGGIVGGVVGGLALLTAAALIFFLWRRRKSRTGNGYFLCFGTPPDRSDNDYDVNWPTFDPALGSSSAGQRDNAQGATLPDVDDGEEGYSPDEDMREMRSNGQGSYNHSGAYYGAAAAAGGGVAASAYSSNLHHGSYQNPSEEGHYGNASQGWAGVPPIGSHNGTDDTPTYDHLDPPEVRQARAREQAQAQAQAYGAYSNGESSPPMHPSVPAPAYYRGTSPPLPQTPHALPPNMHMDSFPNGEGTFEPQSDQQTKLHLHNPEGY